MEYKVLFRIMLSLLMGFMIGKFISDDSFNNVKTLQL